MPNAFDDFIERQTAPVDEPQVDWQKERREWVERLAGFYEQVENFLRRYIAQGKVRLQRGTKDLNEEKIGAYVVETLALDIGANRIDFDPIGTVLMGAKGRVDMKSARGTVKFVLVPKDASRIGWRTRVVENGEETASKSVVPPPPVDWVWKIATPPPDIRCLELNEESFQDAIMEVVNG